jgi:hypothetical protein
MVHGAIPAGTAEVLGYNSGFSDPVAEVIRSWQSSPVHNGILSDRSYGRIGCAERSIGGKHWFVCVLATCGWTGRAGASTGGGASLPDTAMQAPD